MRTIKVSDVFRGDSVRIENGSQVGLPVFGRFAAIVRQDWIAACFFDAAEDSDEDWSGESCWFVRLPNGSTLAPFASEEDAIERAEAIAASGQSGWTTDRNAAVESAIASAKRRHNEACGRGTYRAKFGEPVAQ